MKYRLTQGPVKGKIAGPLGHRIEFDFEERRTTPKSEEDEWAFQHLVSIGLAELVSDKPEAKREEA